MGKSQKVAMGNPAIGKAWTKGGSGRKEKKREITFEIIFTVFFLLKGTLH
jgi:hypothetical protein